MKVSIIDIQLPAAEARLKPFDVPVLLDIDGDRTWFELHVDTEVLRDLPAELISASPELRAVFHSDQRSLHQITHIVGRALRQVPVHLPQRIAA